MKRTFPTGPPLGLMLLLSCILVMGSPAPAQSQEPDTLEAAYQEMRSRLGRLYQDEQFLEAASLLEDALPRYPNHLHANCFNLALVRVRSGHVHEALDALLYGLDHGIWFGKYAFTEDLWQPLRARPGWQEFQDRNARALARAQERVEPRLEVQLPRGYHPAGSYPLFLALHGGGENLDLFMPHWTSPLLETDFIVAYPQASRLISPGGYSWTEDMSLSLQEIQAAYREMVERYAVDTREIIVGGFSSGGVASLEVVLRDALPVKGFVVLCPAMPEDFTLELARSARGRGVRGTLFTTERDHRVPDQQRMAGIMTEAGLAHEFHIFPDIGHWYPDDFGQQLDAAIRHIRAGRER